MPASDVRRESSALAKFVGIAVGTLHSQTSRYQQIPTAEFGAWHGRQTQSVGRGDPCGEAAREAFQAH